MTVGTSRRLARGAVPQGRRGVSIGEDPARPEPRAPDDDMPILPIRARPVPGRPGLGAAAGSRRRRRRPSAWAVVLGAALIAGIGSAGYVLVRQGSGVQRAAGVHDAAPHRSGHASHPAPTATHAATAPAAAAWPRVLAPASASAIGFAGRPGDNSDLAKLAIDRKPTTAWRTDWYTTARFGNLYPGTGLLLDMGRAVTITAVRITLSRAPGAGLQVRVGSAPRLTSLRPVAHAANASGVVHLRTARPAHGRYVLLWFTRLPPDRAGTFEERVSGIRVKGRS
jgi:hypothetical protein